MWSHLLKSPLSPSDVFLLSKKSSLRWRTLPLPGHAGPLQARSPCGARTFKSVRRPEGLLKDDALLHLHSSRSVLLAKHTPPSWLPPSRLNGSYGHELSPLGIGLNVRSASFITRLLFFIRRKKVRSDEHTSGAFLRHQVGAEPSGELGLHEYSRALTTRPRRSWRATLCSAPLRSLRTLTPWVREPGHGLLKTRPFMALGVTYCKYGSPYLEKYEESANHASCSTAFLPRCARRLRARPRKSLRERLSIPD